MAIRFPGTSSPAYDAVFVTAGDPAAVRAHAGLRACSSRLRVRSRTLAASGVELDALVGSGSDDGERYRPGDLDPPPRLIVRTAGAEGGAYEAADGRSGTFEPAPLPGPIADAYGCGDSFAGGLTFALGAGLPLDEALGLAARCGAAELAGHGAYAGQLRLVG